MSLASDIAAIINSSVTNKLGAIDNKKVVGIAYPFPQKKGDDTLIKIVPAIYAIDGTGDMIDLNDAFSIILYHRLTSITYQLVQKGAKGDGYLQQAIIDAYMVVWAQRSKVLISADDLNDKIVNALPARISGLDGVIKCTLTPSLSDFDFIRVFRQEYQSVNYFLEPDHILLQIKYRAVALVNTNCII